jgi:putative transposase
MPRPPRFFPDNVPQHIVNRGDQRERIFRSDADYLGFLAGMADAAEHTVVRVLSFSLMPNHFHLVLWPFRGAEISTYMQRLMNAHLQDLVPRHGTSGLGHVYQGRFRPFEIKNDGHLLNVCRYVEANAFRAGLVQRAEEWRWSSLTCCGPDPEIDLLSPWPIPRPHDWLEQVNRRPLALPVPRAWLAPEVPATSRRQRRELRQLLESLAKPWHPTASTAERPVHVDSGQRRAG